MQNKNAAKRAAHPKPIFFFIRTSFLCVNYLPVSSFSIFTTSFIGATNPASSVLLAAKNFRCEPPPCPTTEGTPPLLSIPSRLSRNSVSVRVAMPRNFISTIIAVSVMISRPRLHLTFISSFIRKILSGVGNHPHSCYAEATDRRVCVHPRRARSALPDARCAHPPHVVRISRGNRSPSAVQHL